MRLLIADDEDYTREGLVESVPWDKYGIDEIMQARDGQEALKISGWFKPDIVLTDIRMPKLNGLEFAERLLKQCPNSKILFMSGFMEIDYLKKAISLAAVEFVEKPIELNKVEEAVKKAVEFVKEKEQHVKKDRQWKTLERQRLLNMLKLKKKDKTLIYKICRELEFPTKANYMTVVLWDKMDVSNSIENEPFMEEETDNLELLVSRLWERAGMQTLFTRLDHGKYLLLTAYGEYQKSQVKIWCRDMAKLKEGLCIGIGFETDNLMAVAQSYEIALFNVEQSFFDSSRTVFEMGNSIPEMKKLNPGLYADFAQVLKKDPIQVQKWMQQLIGDICGGGIYRQEDIVMSMSAFAKLLIQEKNALLLSVDNIYTEDDVERMIREATSIDEIFGLFEKILAAFTSQVEQGAQYSRLVRDTILYIEQQCQEAGLSVVDVAESLHLTAAHLGVLFRKETGVTVKQYISDYRLNLSRKLLLNEHYKIVDIAVRCGYSNANYFAKVFRNAEGMTPIEYRKKHMK